MTTETIIMKGTWFKSYLLTLLKSSLIIILLIINMFNLSCFTNNYLKSEQNNENISFIQNTTKKVILDEELENNHKIWLKSEIRNYSFEIEINKVGPNQSMISAKIKVENGTAVEIIPLENTNMIETKRNEIKSFDTIEKLFNFIEQTLKQKKEYLETNKPLIGKFKVSYDSKLGYPKQIIYIPFSGAMDGDLSMKINNFKI